MRKQLLSFTLAVLMLLPVLSVPAAAATEPAAIPTSAADDIIIQDGNYYIVVHLVSGENVTRSSTTSYTANFNVYTNDQVTLLYSAKFSASYTYDGRRAFCTGADVSYTFHDSSYYLVESNIDKTENVATLTFTVGKKVLGITVAKKTHIITQICDRYGVVSYEAT